MKPTRCINFSNLFLKWNSTCFGHFLCPSSGVFPCTHSNRICHTGLLTACEKDQDAPLWHCSQVVSKPVWHIPLLCVQWKTPDDGQRNCPKHAEFHSKNKFEKLVHLVGFIVRNLLRCTVTWTSNRPLCSLRFCIDAIQTHCINLGIIHSRNLSVYYSSQVVVLLRYVMLWLIWYPNKSYIHFICKFCVS